MASRMVNFEFDLDDKVTTPFGDLGIIGMLGCDEGGPCYYVKTQTGSNWFKEAQLSIS